PLLSQGYLTSQPGAIVPPGYTQPAGQPLVVSVQIPPGGAVKPTPMPTPIPARRLFQAPDAYGQWAAFANSYSTANVPAPMRNPGDTAAPYLKPQTPTAPPPQKAVQPPAQRVFALNNGKPSLPWSGGSQYAVGGPALPPIPPTGVLPPVQPPGVPATAGAPL